MPEPNRMEQPNSHPKFCAVMDLFPVMISDESPHTVITKFPIPPHQTRPYTQAAPQNKSAQKLPGQHGINKKSPP
ncbi:hypothetical protein DSM19430T_06570 [Desulfovibrio psychrotolerans]|uniref:Uncharacterized protein n=1 Tax=Desulfovibrio psychrotolerans TaxID=415242 RepID=A0A7J0BQI2_9BACT|nr:hypothetical protein DSM19430T_06570 [Desulfovibrio psychrotolerans]